MSSLRFTKPEQAHGLKAFWMDAGAAANRGARALRHSRHWSPSCSQPQSGDTQSDPSRRMSALVLAVALAAPYLFVYDLTILAPVSIWLVDWFPPP